MRAVQKNRKLALHVVATGSHLLPPARTVREVKAAFPKALTVPMQRAGKTGRLNDAAATARGIHGLTRVFARIKPDWVVVLGDRIEAFAAASAASIAGIAVCHIHGGDRAEGIADEAMRHAITKLSHLHCAATEQSRGRIVKMGERPEHVFNTGSPAIDGLDKIPVISRAAFKALGEPRAIVLAHPAGVSHDDNYLTSWTASHCAIEVIGRKCMLHIEPNHDAGRESILENLNYYFWGSNPFLSRRSHLPRKEFVGLLKRFRQKRYGVLTGNSSAGLIECAALGVPAIDIGARQHGRETPSNVLHIEVRKDLRTLDPLIMRQHVLGVYARAPQHPYGDGRAGPRIAALLAKLDPHDPALLRKRNAY